MIDLTIFHKPDHHIRLWVLNANEKSLLVEFEQGGHVSELHPEVIWDAHTNQAFLFTHLTDENIASIKTGIDAGTSIFEITINGICGLFPCQTIRKGRDTSN